MEQTIYTVRLWLKPKFQEDKLTPANGRIQQATCFVNMSQAQCQSQRAGTQHNGKEEVSLTNEKKKTKKRGGCRYKSYQEHKNTEVVYKTRYIVARKAKPTKENYLNKKNTMFSYFKQSYNELNVYRVLKKKLHKQTSSLYVKMDK